MLEEVIREGGKCVNKTGYHHVATGFPEYECVRPATCGVRNGVMRGVVFQG